MGDTIKLNYKELIKDNKLLYGIRSEKVAIVPAYIYGQDGKTDNRDKRYLGLGYIWQESNFHICGMLLSQENSGDISVEIDGVLKKFQVSEPGWKYAIWGENMRPDEISERFGKSSLYVPKEEKTMHAIKRLFNEHSAQYFSDGFTVPDARLRDLIK